LARFYTDFTWPDQPYPDNRYYLANSWFGHGDAISLYGVLRYFRPNRVIEMGSGFSSALILDTNEKFLAHAVRFTFFDPFPERLRSLLRDTDRQNVGVVPDIVQNVPIATFSELDANDILFVDSLPVAKIGSDVNYLIFEILPALKPGVLVHFHDILWPFEYPLEWVLASTAWNEAYVVRAFLQYNHTFEMLLFNSYLGDKFASLFEALMPNFLKDIGGSLCLRKRGIVDSALCDS
jgi:Methyltransferase domain